MNKDDIYAAYCQGWIAVKSGTPAPAFDSIIKCVAALKGAIDASSSTTTTPQVFAQSVVVDFVVAQLDDSPAYPRTP